MLAAAILLHDGAKSNPAPLCHFLGLRSLHCKLFQNDWKPINFCWKRCDYYSHKQRKTWDGQSSQFTHDKPGDPHFPWFFGAVIQCKITREFIIHEG